MRGGAIEYSPLPCHAEGTMLPNPNVPGATYNASGVTDFDSTKQVGHETCVEYGTDGAELDPRAAGLGAGRLGDMSIKETIQDAVDAALSARATARVAARAANNTGNYDAEQAAEAARTEAN